MRGKKAKLLRKIAKLKAKEPDSLRAIERQVFKPMFELRPGPWKPEFDNRMVKNPRAKKERSKYVMRIQMIKKLQAYWMPGCARRIYKDLKRALGRG